MIKIFQRLSSTAVMPARAAGKTKVGVVFELLRSVFNSRSHQSFELKAWNAYLDLGPEKAAVPPHLYGQVLVFLSANNIHSPQHKKLAFQRVGKDILFTKALKPNAHWDWEYLCFLTKL